MSNTIKTIGLVIAGVVVGVLLSGVFGSSESNVGGRYNNVEVDFAEGISVDGTTVIDGSGNVDAPITTSTLTTTGASTFGADVTITTSNTATSSIEVGCIDTYATSTDTAVRLSATTTPGIAYWSYGTCSTL